MSILADDHATGSDHVVIESDVKADRQEEADRKWIVGWNSAGMMEEDAEAAEKLWRELAIEGAHLDAEGMADEVEQVAAWCQEAMGNVLDGKAKNIRICPISNRQWNTDFKKRRKAVEPEKLRRRNWEEAARVKAELQNSIGQSKRQMCRKYLQTQWGAKVGRAVRYANPQAGTTVEA